MLDLLLRKAEEVSLRPACLHWRTPLFHPLFLRRQDLWGALFISTVNALACEYWANHLSSAIFARACGSERRSLPLYSTVAKARRTHHNTLLIYRPVAFRHCPLFETFPFPPLVLSSQTAPNLGRIANRWSALSIGGHLPSRPDCANERSRAMYLGPTS